jgi:BirA family biotin operon repressor/biotin-[acetyl-CoA-carboxylase] ligase
MDVGTLTSLLAGLPVTQIRYFDTLGSTNDEALSWVQEGAQDGSLVVADQQTQGRGRLNRRWVTRPGAALAFSLIMQPNQEEVNHVGFFSPLGALAICQSLERLFGLTPQIKWPNDVLLRGRKAAGILVEAAWLGDCLQGMIIGIGINVKPEAVPPAGELLFPASSVEEAAGRPVDRMALLREIVGAMFEWRSKILDEGFRQAWEQRLAFRGQWVQIEGTDNKPVTGEVLGIDATGSLLLRNLAGTTLAITVGDVHLRPME